MVSTLFNPMLLSVNAAEEPFPLYSVIHSNVSFWVRIFTHYSTLQAVVHDSVDLNIIYEVIDLKPVDHPGARKINRHRMKKVNRKYAQVLKRLAADPLAEDADCRRVAALFGSRANARTFRHARDRVRCQIGQRDRFHAGLVRSGAYIDEIRTILKAYGLPEDLAYLPHVESSFNTNAYSKFGAAGMWQFTRSTAKRFMTVDDVVDERRDPIVAAHAAAQLLKENHDRLGSWPLAITAYNHGAAGMQRAKSAYGDYAEIFKSFKGRTFKFASRNFYSEFLAARRVASDYQRYFGELVLKTPMRLTSVNLEGFAALTDICRHFKVSPKVVRIMNPALGPPVFSGQKYIPKGYLLCLPGHVEANGVFLSEIPTRLLKKEQKPSRFYSVKRGDTAGRIARMHQVKLADLILANNLNRQATVYAGQRLRIPQPGQPVHIENTVQRPAPNTSVVHAAAVVKDDRIFSVPADLPVEDVVARYRGKEPAPADPIAMADGEREKALKNSSGL
jgi:membrane-bound lytic murein transglycosylase D